MSIVAHLWCLIAGVCLGLFFVQMVEHDYALAVFYGGMTVLCTVWAIEENKPPSNPPWTYTFS